MSESFWQHVNEYWNQDSATRPATEVVVQQMGLNCATGLASRISLTSRCDPAPYGNKDGEAEWKFQNVPRSPDARAPDEEAVQGKPLYIVGEEEWLPRIVNTPDELNNRLRQIIRNDDPKMVYSMIRQLPGRYVLHYFIFR